MKLAMAQINPTVGDLEGNTRLVVDAIRRSRDKGVELVVFPELGLCGYPILDLVFDDDFVKENKEKLLEVVAESSDIVVVVGFIDQQGTKKYNAAAVIENGRINGIVHKTLLPTYDVFDEERHFSRGTGSKPIKLKNGTRLGVTICEDIWDDNYETKPCEILAHDGIDLLVNLSASPFHVDKDNVRYNLLTRHATTIGVPAIYCNLVGGQDELIFDGNSFAVDWQGRRFAMAKGFEPDLVVFETGDLLKHKPYDVSSREEQIFKALVLGVRDYFTKTGIPGPAVIGLSGGIDSALTAVIATEALGKELVIGVSMPSKFSSEHSKTDAAELAKRLGIEYHEMSIQKSIDVAMERFEWTFGPGGYQDNVTIENLQARERGKTLMEIANDKHGLVLSTGNKTELSLGYCTMYGDLAGGLAVIGDLGKHDVYALALWLNKNRGNPIPQNSIAKTPSAELATGQTDPFDYTVIGPLVNEIIERRTSRAQLIEMGYPIKEVDRCLSLIQKNEFKRKQAPPVLKVTVHSFGLGWKMPIVNGFRR